MKLCIYLINQIWFCLHHIYTLLLTVIQLAFYIYIFSPKLAFSLKLMKISLLCWEMLTTLLFKNYFCFYWHIYFIDICIQQRCEFNVNLCVLWLFLPLPSFFSNLFPSSLFTFIPQTFFQLSVLCYMLLKNLGGKHICPSNSILLSSYIF